MSTRHRAYFTHVWPKPPSRFNAGRPHLPTGGDRTERHRFGRSAPRIPGVLRSLVGLVLLASLGACDTREATLEELLIRGVDDGVPGILIYADSDITPFSGAAGVADRDARVALAPDARFRIASNSKMFIGLLAAQLHIAGELSLDARISTYLPTEVIARIPNAADVTVRQLLNHTSGFYDYLANEAFYAAVEANPTHPWTEAEALTYAFDQPAEFEPGAGWGYSNTNYILMGLVLDTVVGGHHASAIRARILEPLGMEDTYYEHAETPALDFVHGYHRLDGSLTDMHAVNFAHGMADGGLISNASDLVVFVRALGARDERLGAEAIDLMFADMQDAGPFRYGLGVVELVHNGKVLIAHGGGIPGYSSGVYYHRETNAALVVFASGTGDGLDGTYGSTSNAALDIVFP